MANITASQVKELRDKTGAGMMDCKKALKDCEGDFEKAVKYLRKKGISDASKRSGRATKEGLVYSYIHPGNRIGVLVEINCETDFVARNETFQGLVKDIAMHIAASSPKYITRGEVSQDLIDAERELLINQAKESGKPDHVVEKIVEGRIDKFYAQICLLEQPFIKDMNVSIDDLLKESIGKIGENISVRRFSRYQLGEDLD